MKHEDYMKIAIAYAKAKNPIWPFAALIVDRDGNILIQAANASDLSPTFHAEIVALNALAKEYPGVTLNGPLTLYTTGECCPMCQSGIYWANLSGMNIQTVVYGTTIPTLQRLWGTQINIPSQEVVGQSPNNQVVLIGPILEKECDKLFEVAKRLQQRESIQSTTPIPPKPLKNSYTAPAKELRLKQETAPRARL